MYKFELAENSRTTVNYQRLSSAYAKSKIYSLLLVCSLISCSLVYVLVKFIALNEDTSRSQVFNRQTENGFSSNFNGIAENTTEMAGKTSFKGPNMKLVTKTSQESKEIPLQHTSSKSMPVNSLATGSHSLDPSEVTSAPMSTTSEPPVSVSISTQRTHGVTSSSEAIEHKQGSQGNFTEPCGVRGVEEPSYGRSLSINTYFGEFPWMLVLLYLNHSSENAFKCGASLIAPDVALTAAHCVSSQYGVEYKVRAGDWYLGGDLKKEFLPPQERNVVDIEIHPSFSSKNLENNIALLKLESTLIYDDHIRPICLPDWNIQYDPTNCVVSGWGKDSTDDKKYHEFLRQVGLKLVPMDECENKLRASVLGKYYQLSMGELCASNASSDVVSCKGDGGGPLICPSTSNPHLFYQVGVSTWTVQCDPSIPGLYTNVEYHRDWIDRIMVKFQDAPLSNVQDVRSEWSVKPEDQRSA